MATADLNNLGVWTEKPLFDNAECLYYEKLAKMVPRKIVDNVSLINDLSSPLLIANSAIKSKSKKSKDNSITLDLNIEKHSKCHSKKSSKIKEELTSESKNIELINNINSTSDDTAELENRLIKIKLRKNKEKKYKSELKHRNSLDYKNDENKEKCLHQIQGNQETTYSNSPAGGSLADEVAKARQHIKQSLQCMDGIEAYAGVTNSDLFSFVTEIEKENSSIKNTIVELKSIVSQLAERLKIVEEAKKNSWPNLQICPAKPPSPTPPKPSKKEDEDDDGVDLFASDSEGEDAEAAKIREERLAAYAAKKAKKPALIAKSNIILDVKPWDDETNMTEMEAVVRKIECEGLLWGAAKLVPLAYGINKLQISCVVEDEKVSVDWLIEQIQESEDYVQSVDIAAFNKI